MATKVERAKIKRSQKRVTETHEEAAARRLARTEKMRKYRQILLANETPEEETARRSKQTQQRSKYKYKRVPAKPTEIDETPEEIAARLINLIKIRHEKQAKETPEERTARLLYARKMAKKTHDMQRAKETPDEKAARLRQAAERDRQRMAIIRATKYVIETIEEKEARYELQRERCRRNVAKKRARDAPEESAAQRAKNAAKESERRAKIIATETPEKKEARLAEIRRHRKQRLANETPEEKAARCKYIRMAYKKRLAKAKKAAEYAAQRAKISAQMREKYVKNKLIQKNFNADEIAARRMKIVERDQKIREQLTKISEEKRRAENKLARQIKSQQKKDAANLKKEEKQARIAEKRRIRREKIAKETPERKAKRLELKRQSYKKLRAKETPEENAARRAKRAAQMREKKQMLKKTPKQQNTTEDKVPVVKLEDIDFDESCTGSFLETSEGNFSITTDASFNFNTTETSFSTIETTTDGSQPALKDSEGSTRIKEEPSEDSWSSFKISESSYVTQEMSQPSVSHEGPEKKRIKTEDNELREDLQTTREEYAVYGEYLADKFRKCNRNSAEINVARKLIESIMCNLSAGVYSSLSSGDANELDEDEKPLILPTPPVVAPVVQAIIVKEEVDL